MKPTALPGNDVESSLRGDRNRMDDKRSLAELRRLRIPRQWTDADRCIIWLVLGLAIYVPYLFRINYVLAHPEIEPYFARPALAIFARCLAGVVALSLLLIGYVLLRGERGSGYPWTVRISNQLHFVWIAVSAYAIGPFTTPILGLLLAAVTIAALLFPADVVVRGVLSAVVILVVTTVAERLGWLDYSPLLALPPLAAGRPSDAYIIGTGLATLLALISTTMVILYLVGSTRRREEELTIANRVQGRTAAELQHALESLRESEERFRQLADNAREVFWLMDAHSGQLLYLSQTFEPMWGLPVTQMYERFDRFLDVIHPEDRETVGRRLSELSTIRTSGEAERVIQYRIVRPTDGEQLWVQIRAFPVRDEQGRVYRIGGLIEDITARKATEAALEQSRQALEERVIERTEALSRSNEQLQREAAERERAEAALRRSEQRLRRQFAELEQLYDTAPIGLSLHDTDLRYLRINARLAAINGLPVTAHIGRTVRETIPEISDTVEPYLEQVIETGAPVLNVEIAGSTPAEPDVVRKFMTSYYPLKSPEGEVIGVNAIVQDISERVWAEERARRHLEDLAHVTRLTTMGEMAAGIAHELNQPLAAMANFAFIGLHQLENATTADVDGLGDLFQEVSDQALRAGDIVQRLRNFTRKTSPQRADVSVNDLVHDVLTLVDADLRMSSVQPDLMLAEVPRVHADPIQIQQVVLNLVRNALEAMADTPAADRRLRIATSSPTSDVVEVAVSDSGPGLREEVRGKIFDAFFTTKTSGMGMGLAISRSIIEDHDGRMWGESAPEGGATFRFSLPTAVGEHETRS